MWSRRPHPLLLPFLIAALIYPYPCFAVDIYQTLRDDAKKLIRPVLPPGPAFAGISALNPKDPLFAFETFLKTPEQNQDAAKVLLRSGDPVLNALILSGITTQFDESELDFSDALSDDVATESSDDNDYDQNEISGDDAIDSTGIISTMRSNVQPGVYSLSRPHAKQTILFPMFLRNVWQDMRQEKSLSITEAQDDFLADRPMNEFCIEDAGLGLPTSARLQFSIFDIGIAEASSSSLDLAYLHLLEQPDAFRSTTAANERLQSDAAYREVTWQAVLAEWQTDPNKSKKKLVDLADWWKQENPDADAKDDRYKFAIALSQVIKRWSVDCGKSGGKWLENLTLRKAKPEWILGECQIIGNQPLFRMAINDTLAENATAFTILQRQGVVISTTQLLAEESEQHALLFYLGKTDDPQPGATLVYDEQGRMRERIGPKSSLIHAAWDSKGQLVWTGRQNANGQWTQDLTWDPSGKPRAEFFFDSDGGVKSIVEWYADYKPASVSHFVSEHREGLQQWWHENGKLAGDSMWSYGKRLGTSKIQFDQGVVGFDASYIDDQLDGTMIWRDDLSHEVMRVNFKHGLVEGTISLKSDPKTELAHATFDHGLAEGEVRFGQPGLQPSVTFPFKSGILDGTTTFYNAKHAVRLQVPFRSGKLNGDLKAFYQNGAKAAACKFDTGHLLTWNSWPKQNDPDTLKIEGRVLDVATTRMTQTIFDDTKKISALCEGREGVWHHCTFTVKGKPYNITEADLLKATKDVMLEDGPYNMNQCGGAIQVWNLKPWIETGSVSAQLELTRSSGCRDMRAVFCKVAVTNRLQVSDCRAADNESEDEDGHDHDE